MQLEKTLIGLLTAYSATIHFPLVSLISAFGFATNVANLVVLTQPTMRRVPANIMLVGLSGAHLLLVVNYFMYTIYASVLDGECRFEAKSYWWLAALLVNVNISLVIVIIQVAICWLLALYRCASTLCPRRFKFTRRKARVGVVFIYCAIPIITVPFYFNSHISPYTTDDNCSSLLLANGGPVEAYKLSYSSNKLLILYSFWFYGVVCKLVPSISMAVMGPIQIFTLVNLQQNRRRRFPNMTNGRNRHRKTAICETNTVLWKQGNEPQSTIQNSTFPGGIRRSVDGPAVSPGFFSNCSLEHPPSMGKPPRPKRPASVCVTSFAQRNTNGTPPGQEPDAPAEQSNSVVHTIVEGTPLLLYTALPEHQLRNTGSCSTLIISNAKRSSDAATVRSGRNSSTMTNGLNGVGQRRVHPWHIPLMLAAVSCLCVLVELPQGLINFAFGMHNAGLWAFPSNQLYYALGDFFEMLTLLYCIVNFVLYCSMSSQFRRTFKHCFCCDRSELPIMSTTSVGRRRGRLMEAMNRLGTVASLALLRGRNISGRALRSASRDSAR